LRQACRQRRRRVSAPRAAAFQELRAEHNHELAHCDGERWRRQAEALGGAPEVEAFGHGHELFQLA
jgi:hypothetical protein